MTEYRQGPSLGCVPRRFENPAATCSPTIGSRHGNSRKFPGNPRRWHEREAGDRGTRYRQDVGRHGQVSRWASIFGCLTLRRRRRMPLLPHRGEAHAHHCLAGRPPRTMPRRSRRMGFSNVRYHPTVGAAPRKAGLVRKDQRPRGPGRSPRWNAARVEARMGQVDPRNADVASPALSPTIPKRPRHSTRQIPAGADRPRTHHRTVPQ